MRPTHLSFTRFPDVPLPWWDNGTLPSLRGMIRNTLSRAPMGHRWWHNDPDCLMLGSHTKLTNEEVASAASIVAMTCGMLLLSDDLPKLPPKRMDICNKIFPLTGVPSIVLDLHSTNDGLPTLLRLWCTDKHGLADSYRESSERHNNAEATFFARQASFRPEVDYDSSPERERRRSCVHVSKGLGTWTVLCISNWLDKPAVVQVPPLALLPSTDSGDSEGVVAASTTYHGYHVFAFWSSRYSWLPAIQEYDKEQETITRKLKAHESEIYHVKPVSPNSPQYIGSDLHFSCGREVTNFFTAESHVSLSFDVSYQRDGYVFVFLPVTESKNIRALSGGLATSIESVGNTPRLSSNGSPQLAGRVFRIAVTIHADGRPTDGVIQINY